MKFRYAAAKASGEIVRGSRSAETKEALGRMIASEGLMLMSAQPIGSSMKHTLASFELGRVPAIDIVLFARHLAVMMKSGMALAESLSIIADQTSRQSFKKIILNICESVKNGTRLAESCERHPKVFNGLSVNMIRIGESSGTLDTSLEYLANELEKEYELRQKVRGALLYPLIILIATVGIGGALSVFVLPKLVTLFSGMDITLPVATRVFLSIATFLSAWGIWIALGMIILMLVLRMTRHTRVIGSLIDRTALWVPFSRSMTQQVVMARCTRTLALLLKSGLPLVEALTITRGTIGNSVYASHLLTIQKKVETGAVLGKTLGEHERYFPRIVSRMISVGEKTGKLDQTLSYLSAFYDLEVDNATRNLTTIIEPALLIAIGVIVGGLGIAIITPIYQLSGSLGR
ncbi:MAG: type II secretion system F family protein [Patescibacteria group bacterium]|jgi:type IV pilus assembly protein PilC